MNWRPWLYSLFSAGIGGAASSLGGVIVAPSVFNFTPEGWAKIGELALFGFAVPVLALLKQSPLPGIQTTTHTLTETTTVDPAPTDPPKKDTP
jgi:hypothetical protein